MRPSPGLVLAALLVVTVTQATRLVAPGRGAYVWTLLLGAAGLVAGEIAAAWSRVGGPTLGALHPVVDVAVMAAFELAGALLVAIPAGRGLDDT